MVVVSLAKNQLENKQLAVCGNGGGKIDKVDARCEIIQFQGWLFISVLLIQLNSFEWSALELSSFLYLLLDSNR